MTKLLAHGNGHSICAIVSAIVFLSLGLVAHAGPAIIQPGAIWPDDQGLHIQAHGGGIIEFSNTFYWFGEDRSPGNDRRFRYAACYASTDLAHWKFRNQVLKLPNIEHLRRGWVVERPKVFYNPKTGKFVMYFHLDGAYTNEAPGYKLARVGVAVCDTIDGNYTCIKTFRPLGNESRDIGQFIDDDGSAYLISEDRPNGFHIYKLSNDYLSVEKDVCLIHEHLEGGALVHFDGLYYVIGSHLTGWNPNPNVYATAKSLAGPWSEFKNIAPPESKTYGSQSTMLLKIRGTKATTVIYMGDIWRPWELSDSRYLWMPLDIGGGHLSLPEPARWTMDIETGEAKILK